MKLFNRIVLIFATISMVVGITLVIIGVVGGGHFLHVGTHHYKTEDVNQSFSSAKIDSLKFSIDCAKLEIKRGDFFRVVGKNLVKNGYTIGVKDGTLIVDQRLSNEEFKIFGLKLHLDLGWWDTESKITVYVPDNFKADDLNINMNSGRINIDDVTAKKADITLNAGSIHADNLKITDQCGLEVNAGSLKIEDGEMNNLEMNISAGSAKYEGRIYGENSVDCSAGSVKFDLDQDEDEFAFDCDSSAGSIKVNHHKYSDDEGSFNKGAKNSMDLSCSAGSIKVETE